MAKWGRSFLPRSAPALPLGWQVLGLAAGAYAVKRLVDVRRVHRLHDQVVLITGGSRGLGLLLAREFGRKGCRLAICARDGAELERARLGLEHRGYQVFASVCDVSDPAAVDRLMAEVLDHYGRLDILVNNASVMHVGALSSMDLLDFRQAMATNYWGTVHTTLAAIEPLKQAGGRIVNICSIGGKVAVPHLLPYDAAKFAVLGFSEGLRAELAGEGISVTTIIPGLMRTGSYSHATFKGDQLGEFEWFSTVASEHATTIDARQAARRIVLATARREPEVILGWHARFAALAKAVLPNTLIRVLGLANRALPHSSRKSIGLSGRTLAAAVNRARYS
jgi:NAD(P)-dependent dehydrogenase (short-subunit alcohol dehydrogenase family)